jgi:hypothetical protein
MNFERIYEKVNPGIYYHLSPKRLKILEPKTPENYITKKGKEDSTSRVCLAPSIENCLIGFSNPDLDGTELYVYEINIANLQCKEPTQKQVPDKKLTGEIWVLEDILIDGKTGKCNGKIKVIEPEDARTGPMGDWESFRNNAVKIGNYVSWKYDYKFIR